MSWLVYIAACLLSLLILHRLGLFLESKGWLNYTRASRKSRTSLVLAAVIDPAARQILEIQEQERDEEGEQGEDYDPANESSKPPGSDQ